MAPRGLAVAGWLGLWLAASLCPGQEEAPRSIWPQTGGSHWFWVVPRADLSPAEIDTAFKRAVDEGATYVDPAFSATVFLPRKFRLIEGKSKKRKRYPDRPEKADDLRIEAEWQNGYLNQYRGQTYTYIPLDAVRGLDLHFLPRPQERFPKAPPGRNWNVNVLAGSLYSFFFGMEESARLFINAVNSALAQRGLNLGFSRFGLMWENVTVAQAADMGRQPGAGVLVTMVAVGSPGDHAGIRPLDLVLEVNGEKVSNFSHFALLLDGLAPGVKTPLLLLRRLKPPGQGMDSSPWETLAVQLEAR